MFCAITRAGWPAVFTLPFAMLSTCVTSRNRMPFSPPFYTLLCTVWCGHDVAGWLCINWPQQPLRQGRGSKSGNTFSGGHRLSHRQTIQNSHCPCYPKMLLFEPRPFLVNKTALQRPNTLSPSATSPKAAQPQRHQQACSGAGRGKPHTARRASSRASQCAYLQSREVRRHV